ncbi:MAG: hypothetical protein CL429_04025 [Acidimicrobiaceae bacterium]|nr:hypothetical protein [Acidimicrobiaceae bacterium]
MLATICIVIALFLTTSLANAHDPLFLTTDQQTPSTGPSLPDGTISFAFYGEFSEPNETRGFQAYFEQGDFFQLELLIPAQNPEQILENEKLPYLLIISPNGIEEIIYPNIRIRFDEPFTNTSYFTLIKEQRTALAGVYEITIVSRSPSRFTSAIGTSERFGTPVQRAGDRPTTFDETTQRVNEWYEKIEIPSPKEEKETISEQTEINPAPNSQEKDIEPEPQITESNQSSIMGNSNENPANNTDNQATETIDSSTNRTIWFLVLLTIVAIPVSIIVKRLRKSNLFDNNNS